jgi:hypothetical protein
LTVFFTLLVSLLVKAAHKYNGEIDSGRQFHQSYSRAIFVQNFGAKTIKPKTQLWNFWRKNMDEKRARNTLKKLTPGRWVQNNDICDWNF